jgi:L-rhamnose mutarotase
VWPEILESIKDAGIEEMEIYRTGNRLFMIMETNDSFNFENKARADRTNEKVQQWEELMWKYQQALPTAKPGEKWVLMEKIFETS